MIKWNNINDGNPDEGKSLFLFGYSRCQMVISGDDLVVKDIFRTGEFNGRVTIMNIETKEYFQSDPVKELYINERGRN